jgi:hypothetical protein
MQQPEYYTPDSVDQRDELQLQHELMDTGELPKQRKDVVDSSPDSNDVRETESWDSCLVRALTSWEGTALSDADRARVANSKLLRKMYSDIDGAKTLDASFHEHLDPDELNRRNGDQVVSRYLARSYIKHLREVRHQKKSANGKRDAWGRSSSLTNILGPHQRFGSSRDLLRQSKRNSWLIEDGKTVIGGPPPIRQQVLVVQPLRIWKFKSTNFAVFSSPSPLSVASS